MQYVKSVDYKKGAEDLANNIITKLGEGKKVLWLLTGGSSIPSCVYAMRIVKKEAPDLSRLTVTLTDERYGEVGHSDSSWKKLVDLGFDFEGVNAIPVLKGKSFTDTAKDWEEDVSKVFADSDCIISQFGIGSDLHIAGIIPESDGSEETSLVSHYSTGTFDRITLTFSAIRKIDMAFVFIFGDSKKGVVTKLKESTADPKKVPANILKSIPQVYIYTDQGE
jgi:6-phosphogluconolactonase/glucosamine-6-phosphate isomerase/deaminase